MEHTLIIGRSNTGKTTLAKMLIGAGIKLHGRKAFVMDSLRDPEWKRIGAELFTDEQAFLRVCKLKGNESSYVVVDEGGETIGRYNTGMNFVTTQSRHFGHIAIVITHFLKDIPSTLRRNVRYIYLFACTPKDVQIVNEEFGCEIKWRKLDDGYFIRIDNKGETKYGRILLDKRQLVWLPFDNQSTGSRSESINA